MKINFIFLLAVFVVRQALQMECSQAETVIQTSRALRLITLLAPRTRHMLLKAAITNLSAVHVMKGRVVKATYRLGDFYFDITQFFVFLFRKWKSASLVVLYFVSVCSGLVR
jgi:hypothetical protein